MTDNEIVKALKELLEVMLYEGDLQRASTISKAIEMFDRQKAEIERLQKCHDDMEGAIYSFREDHAKVKFFKNEIRAESVKEFAERLKKECVQDGAFGYVSAYEIDNLVKEMVGDVG